MPKWIWWAAGVILLIMVFQNPAGGGNFVHQAITSVTTFIAHI
jgi:hypothetical protein